MSSMPRLIKVAEPPFRKNFLEHPSVNSLVHHKKKSQDLIQQMYDSERESVRKDLINTSSLNETSFELPKSNISTINFNRFR